MITLEQALNTVGQLSAEQQEVLIQIITNRLIESRREEIAKDAKEAIDAFHKGELLPKSATELIAELRKTLTEGE